MESCSSFEIPNFVDLHINGNILMTVELRDYSGNVLVLGSLII